MKICRLALVNFGLFRGSNEIDLAPKKRHNKSRPVILIGGSNGAGKTTILEAIRLCLYGPLALGERVSQEEYHNYLRACIHRNEGGLIPLQDAAIGLDFEYGLAGRLHQFHVERSWHCHGVTLDSVLTVTRDGTPLDELERANADEFLRDLIPRGVSQLFFFDGEKIQDMAQAADDDVALADAIKELLGLDLISRLGHDLSIYTTRFKETDSPKKLQKELREIDDKLSKLTQQSLQLMRASDQFLSRADRLREEIAVTERKLARTGGAFANQRSSLQEEEALLKQSIKEAEEQFREFCSDLLPFTLASRLCISLREQIDSEKRLQDWGIHHTLLEKQIAKVKESIERNLFPREVSTEITKKTREQIATRVRDILDGLVQMPSELPDVPLLHRLSDEDREGFLGAIHRILNEVPQHAKSFEGTLENQTRRLLQIKSSLDQVPNDDVVEPLMQRLGELNRQLGSAETEANQAKQECKTLDHEIEVQKRLRKKKEDELQLSAKGAERHEMVTRVQAVLAEYSAALTQSKVAELSNAVADCFGQLWRKGDVLSGIKINPETCSVMLLDSQDRVIPKERLSAGEKQIYAISMLWALARVSGRVLPMVIDTPLARLDSKHRNHLVTRYFPNVSHQVVILSTDTEIDQEYFRELGPSISHAFHLRYDDIERRTVKEDGYFWSRAEVEVNA